MSYSSNRGNNTASAVVKMIELSAKASAFALTFFSFAPLHSVSTPFVERYVENAYNYELLAFVGVGWGVLLGTWFATYFCR